MNKILLAIIFIATSVTGYAQKKMVDSLLTALDQEKTDSNRMKIYRRLGNYYTDNNAGKAIGYLERSLEIAQKLNRPLMVANDYYSIAFCYLVKSNFNKALDNYLQSVRIYENLKDSFRLSNAFMSIGNLYSQNKNFAKTIEYYEKARVLIEAQKDSMQLSSLLAQKGTLYDQQLQYDEALNNLQQALLIARLTRDDYMISNTLSNLGLTYKHLRNTNKALRYFDSVLVLYKTMDVPIDNVAAIYNNIAATHSQAGNYPQAREAFDKSIQYAEQAGSPFIIMENYSNLADMFGSMRQFEQQTRYLKKYYTIKDSLFNADNKNQLTELEADYQIEKRNAAIVKKDAEVTRQKGQRNIFIVITIAAAVLLSTLLFFYTRTRKNNRLLKEKNDLIHRQNTELETLNQVKDRLFSIISHDLRSPLVTLRSYLSLADDVSLSADKKEIFKKSTMQAVTQTCDMLDNLLVWANMQIKSAAVSITPINLEDCIQDVENTVQAQATQKNMVIQKQLGAFTALGDHTILTIAIRNILTNAIKFSPPGSSIFIQTQQSGDSVLLSFKDEGIGMTEQQVQQLNSNQTETTRGTQDEKGSGLGIFLVKELLQKINGRLLISSEKDKGSSFTIQLDSM